MQHVVTLVGSEDRYFCDTQMSVLSAVSVSGPGPIRIGCRSGGCGVCRIRVVEGQFKTGCMNREQISPQDEEQGIVLACKTFPDSALKIEVVGRRRACERASDADQSFHRFLSLCRQAA